MTPDQYRREGFRLGIEAAANEWQHVKVESGRAMVALLAYEARIRAIDVDEALADTRPRCAECDCEDGNCTWIKTDSDPVERLVEAAWSEAQRAMTKFPQPNYVISKVAEEAGEVVKAAIHCAEGRETAEAVIGEITQAMGMLMRLYVEGDQVHGLPALAACKGVRDE